MRRILLLITDLEIGGTPTVVRELAIRLNDPPRCEVAVACLSAMGPVGEQLDSAGLWVTAMGARSARDLRAIARLIGLIRDGGFDTVFSFLVHANVAAAAASWVRFGRRWIQSIQTTQPRPRWHWIAQGLIHHAADMIVVPSASVADAAAARSHIPRAKIQVIPNAIDPVSWILRGPPGPDSIERFRVGFVGRLDPVKRVEDLIGAMAILGDDFQLDIHGDGPERARLEALAAPLGDRVRFHGATADPRGAMGAMDAVVLCSQAEGFGLVLIEAMAAGVNVVASDVPGIRDVVDSQRTGLLVPAASPRSLADAIQRLRLDPGLGDRLRIEAAADVRRRFTWEIVLPMYRRLLRLD